MLYAITSGGFADGARQKEMARGLQLQRVEQLVADGRLVLAGTFPAIDSPDPGPAGVTGNLIVAKIDSLEDARSWIDSDPDASRGTSPRVDVKPFLRTRR